MINRVFIMFSLSPNDVAVNQQKLIGGSSDSLFMYNRKAVISVYIPCWLLISSSQMISVKAEVP